MQPRLRAIEIINLLSNQHPDQVRTCICTLLYHFMLLILCSFRKKVGKKSRFTTSTKLLQKQKLGTPHSKNWCVSFPYRCRPFIFVIIAHVILCIFLHFRLPYNRPMVVLLHSFGFFNFFQPPLEIHYRGIFMDPKYGLSCTLIQFT